MRGRTAAARIFRNLIRFVDGRQRSSLHRPASEYAGNAHAIFKRESETDRDVTLDLGQALGRLGRNLRPIVIITGAAILAAIGYLHFATYVFTATLQVTPVEQKTPLSSSGLSGLSSLASLAGSAGISLSTPSQTQLELYLAALKSPDVAGDLVKNPEISRIAFSSQWDGRRNMWRDPSPIKHAIVGAIKAVLGFPLTRWYPPSDQQMMGYIQKNVVISHMPTSPIVTITFKHRNPQFAKSFLLALHNAADQRLRARALDRAAKYIDYLTRELQVVTSTEHRQALINTLSEQEEFRMAASADVSYSVDVFSPPTVTLRPTNPNPAMTIVVAMLLGLVIGSCYVLIKFR